MSRDPNRGSWIVNRGPDPGPRITTQPRALRILGPWLSVVGIIAALLAAPLAVRGRQSGPTSAEVLTLEQAVALALQHNRLVKNAGLEAEKYEAKLAAARTRRLPAFSLYTLGSQQLSEINFTFDRGVFGTFPGIGPIPAENTALTTPRRPTVLIIGQVTQPLSQQYRIGLTLEQLKIGQEIAHEQVRSGATVHHQPGEASLLRDTPDAERTSKR